MIDQLALLCTFAIMGTYLAAEHFDKPRWFTWANVVTFIPVAVANYIAGAPWAVLLNVFFGLTALTSLYRTWRLRQRVLYNLPEMYGMPGYFADRRIERIANEPVSDSKWGDIVNRLADDEAA